MPEASEVGLLACPILAGEARAVLASGDFPEARLVPVPLSCMGPRADEAAAGAALEAAPPSGRALCLLCGGCLRDPAAMVRGRRVLRVAPPGGDCSSLFAPSDLIEGLRRDGAYLLTPGWLSTWRARLAQWGFDREGSRAFFAESASSLALLDTLTDHRAAEELEAFGRHVGLPAVRLPVGLDFLRLLLKEAFGVWRRERDAAESRRASEADRKLSADLAMAFELIHDLSAPRGEEEIVGKILDILTALFAPERVSLSLFGPDGRTRTWSRPEPGGGAQAAAPLEVEYRPTPDGRGFLLRLGTEWEPLGTLRVENVAFPSYMERYLGMALTVAQVGALSIGNARAYGSLRTAVRDLRDTITHVGTLKALLPICSNCKRIRDADGIWHAVDSYFHDHAGTAFSHCTCPECLRKLYPEAARNGV